jgi:branched-chain amino acid transport system ATP-binding protein
MILQTTGLTKVFGGLTAVDGVDLQVEEREIRALIGPNGSGKTTLLNCISGVYRPDSGSVEFRGEQVGGLPPHTLTRKGIGRTFQDIRLFQSLTVLQNVMVALQCRTHATMVEDILALPRSRREERQMREEAYSYLEFVGFAEKWNAPAGGLSYGQRRMVEIARALATGAKLLLLDEPTAGLSGAAIDRLTEGILRIRDEGLSMILVEHNMRFVLSICDRVTVLDFGEKIAEGTPEECRNNPLIIECFLGGKFGSDTQA